MIGVTGDIFGRSTDIGDILSQSTYNYTKCRKNIGDNGEMFMI